MSDGSRFSGESSEDFANSTNNRVSRTSPGPGNILALDAKFRAEIEKVCNDEGNFHAVVLDREQCAVEFFVFHLAQQIGNHVYIFSSSDFGYK